MAQGFFGTTASKIQRAATPQTGFWATLGQTATRIGTGVLQYQAAKKFQSRQPGMPPYLPPPFPPPATQSNLPEVATRPQTTAKNGANMMTILLVAGAGLLLFMRR